MTHQPYGGSPEPFLPPQGSPDPQPPSAFPAQPAGPPYQPYPYQHNPYQHDPYWHTAPQPPFPSGPARYPAPAHPGFQHPLAPVQYKDPTVGWLLWIFVGYVGGHLFYLGRTRRGVAYAVTFALSLLFSLVLVGVLGYLILFVLWVIDGCQLSGRLRQYNAQAYAVNRSMGLP